MTGEFRRHLERQPMLTTFDDLNRPDRMRRWKMAIARAPQRERGRRNYGVIVL
jgi:hypothetical protein